jgi:alpha-mannosidase
VDGRGRRLPAQTVERGGRRELAVALAGVPSLAAKTMHLRCRAARTASGGSAFRIGEDRLETPFYRIRFDRRQRIRSLVDKAAGREIVRAGAALNTLLLAEDLPAQWDNWDIDADIALMLHPAGRLISSGVVSTGPVEHRIRNRYDFGVFHASGRASTLTQDLVLYAHDRRIDFETAVEWNHSHRLLRASFPLDLLADRVRCEIQYGHVERPTSENTSWERAMHEICAHKWVDVSESDYGVALLNDCKYGHHVRGATVDLTLLRSGCHPDEKADQGEHRFTYSLVPHLGGFSAAAVVRPAYELNAPVIVGDGVGAVPDGSSLLTVDNTTTVIESVKKAEDEDALVVRLYDAEKTRRRVTVTASRRVRRVVECDMRERHIRSVPARGNSWTFQLNPFEIKTFKVALGR